MTTNPPSDAVQAQSYYGTQVSGYRLAGVADARIAAPSAPYVGRDGRCSANDNTCEGFSIKDSVLCAGHNRKAGKSKKVS